MADIIETIELEEEVLPANQVVGSIQGQWSYAEYTALPNDGNRYEVVSGVLYLMPSPTIDHQEIAGRIYHYLFIHVNLAGLGKALIAPVDVELPNGTVVQPDVIVVQKVNQKIITSKKIEGAPDLVIEVSSRGTAKYDRTTKLAAYRQAKVKEYWIVVPSKKMVEVYKLEQNDLTLKGTYKGLDLIASEVVPELSVRVEQFFSE